MSLPTAGISALGVGGGGLVVHARSQQRQEIIEEGR